MVSVLVHAGCYNKNTINCVAYKQQTFISHDFAGRESKIKALSDWVSGEGPLPRQLSFHCVLTWRKG